MSYIQLRDYAKHMNIGQGSVAFISSNAENMLWDAFVNKASADLHEFIDGLMETIGPDGTLMFPTYSWDFCQGKDFDYHHTKCRVGTLGTLALEHKGFRRTKHPIYNFAVWGKYQDLLCNMENVDSFGGDSPFAFMRDYGAINYNIDVTLGQSLTFTHFVEEQSGIVPYRFVKNFTAGYVDENGQREIKTYSMFVRYLDMDVVPTMDPIEDDLLAGGAETKLAINSTLIRRLDMAKAYDIMMDDVLHNKSRKLCTYKGQ